MKRMTRNSLSRQQGVSKFGLVLLLALITVFLTVGLKVGPLYIDHNLITGICQDLVDNGQADDMTVTEIRNRVSDGLRVNNVTGFDLSSISKRMENNSAIITINYERRVELFANLDAVAKFDTEIQ
jgi:hypothetical protein